jgi:hypothetical protein
VPLHPFDAHLGDGARIGLGHRIAIALFEYRIADLRDVPQAVDQEAGEGMRFADRQIELQRIVQLGDRRPAADQVRVVA